MDIDAAIHDRFGFELPSLYRELRAAGCFDPHHDSYIQFTDLEWLTADQIFSWVYDPYVVEGLIPFAQTLSGHVWAWYPAIDPDYPAPVVFCPDDDEVGIVYAHDFQHAMYRMLLDEMANTFLVERTDEVQALNQLVKFVEVLSPFFKESWAERLQDLCGNRLMQTQENFYGLIDEDKLEAILKTDIIYDRLDQEFCCLKEET